MGRTNYSATVEAYGAIIRRERSFGDVEVELHIDTLTITKDGETLLEFDITDAEDLAEVLED